MLYVCLVAQSCPTLCNPLDCSSPGSSFHGILMRMKILGGGGCSFLLQGIFPTQGSNLGLLYWQGDSLPSELPGKPLQRMKAKLSDQTLLVFWVRFLWVDIYFGIIDIFKYYVVIMLFWASLVAQMVENLPALWETHTRSLGWEDPFEEEMATHSSILA